MKKVKLNLDKKAIQDFFIQHVEKVLLVAVALLFLLFVYRAVGRETFTRTPQALIDDSEDARVHVKATDPVPPKGVFNKDFRRDVEEKNQPIDVGLYRHRHLWRPLIFEPPPKRGEPLLHTVKDLRGAPGYGAIKVMSLPGSGLEGPMGGGPRMRGDSLQGERWVVITGLVSYDKQVKAYYEAFKNVAGKRQSGPGGPAGPQAGMGPEGAGIDRPVYVHYHVERAEVTSPGQSVDDVDWQPIHVRNAKVEARKAWGSTPGAIGPTPDITGVGLVSPFLRIKALDFPLPPLAGQKSLGEEFAHAPEIPILQKKRLRNYGPDVMPIRPAEDEPTAEKPAAEKPAAEKPEDVPGREDMPMMPGMVPGMERGVGPEMMPGMEGQMYPGEMGMMTPEMMMPGVGPMGMVPGQRGRTLSPYRLFRFVDRSIEPGKRYRYRVRLMLLNPNYKEDPRYLDRLELGKEMYITTDWSKPTGVIEVPRDDRLLVVSVRPSVSVAVEPAAKVVLVKWLHEEGIEADKVFTSGQPEKAYRGQMLNLLNCKWPEEEQKRRARKEKKKKVPGGMPGMEFEGYMGEQPPEAAPMAMPDMFGRGKQEPIDVDYLPESLLLDMRGGHRIDLNGQGYRPNTRDANDNAPGEILFLDPEGRLVARSELEDAAEYEKLQERKKGPGEGPMGPGMYPGPGAYPEGMPDEMYLMGPQPQEGPGKRSSKKGKDRDRKKPKRAGSLRGR